MAANLAKTVDGKVMMAWYGEKPWHGQGTELPAVGTAEEMMKAAHLDWTVEEEPVFLGNGSRIAGYKTMLRSDSREVLSIMSSKYEPIQNAKAFGFFDTVVGAGEAIYHTAGALGVGERVWLMAKLPKNIRVGKTDDVVEQHLLLVNSHDGSSALRMFYTPVRVVCQNTLTMALGRAKGGISIRHSASATLRVAEAQRALGLAVKFYDSVGQFINRLSEIQCNKAMLAEYLKSIFPDNLKAEHNTRTENIRAEASRLFSEGRGNDLPGIKGSLWAAYNGVTEYVDYYRATRGTTEASRANNRLNSIWFGSGANIKQAAYESALQLAGIN